MPVIISNASPLADLLILDNREPRYFARTVNLKMIGTIGIIRLPWMKGIITEPIHEINKLLLNGFWIDEKIIEQIKRILKTRNRHVASGFQTKVV